MHQIQYIFFQKISRKQGLYSPYDESV
ncbi:uncharacterized protein METZ01_LOCUS99890 [marine metagenome]|uniref:Uncharacterized protein n=1 Tax=marine metagenome TaxID=408172 RepID=A0A381W3A6_9ZZZZ